MIVTRGYGSSLIPTRGYGQTSAPKLADMDPQHKGLATRTFSSLTKSRASKALKKRTVVNKWQ